MKTIRFLALVSMFLGSYATADDTTIEFTKIDSGAAGTECAVTWADAIGNLPQPDGIDAFFDGYYCMTSEATCTPGTMFSRYFGSGGPDWVPDGERICYNAGTYGYYNSGTGIGYSLQGETNVTCTNICM